MTIKLVLLLFSLFLAACDRSDQTRYQGYVEGENLYLVSPFSGTLIKKSVDRGQTVEQGLPLFQLDANPEALILHQHQADLRQAEKTLDDLTLPRRPPEIQAIQDQIDQTNSKLTLANLRVKRYEKLRLKGAIDLDSLDAAIANEQELKQVKAQYQANLDLANQGSRSNQIKAQQSVVEAARALVAENQWQLAQKTVLSPTDGVIFDTYYQEGEFVPAQHPIASLLPSNAVRVEFFVPVRVANRLKLGQKISFACEQCSDHHLATIHYISPEAEYIPPLIYSEANTDKLVFRVKAAIAPPTSFKPGQPVTLVIQYDPQ